jgi:type III secretion protein V
MLEQLALRGDVLLGVAVIAVVALIVLPVPLFLLDTLIAVNMSASIGLLMLSFYVPSALALSTFPSLLLFTTLFRLSLNIASTKQILLNADAGHIIDTFGRLVVGGNVVVGLVVFLIIAVVQFIVIAKGAERVAEVGARFTLDGMPGKQMSIDADLRSNLIDKAEARRRRAELEQESKLHGALDGAMKFVKGDAVASMVIAFVNIVAGIAIGMAMNGLPVSDALSTYTVLTVGDGMVSQIPSLFVSIAAGIVITRVGADDGQGGNLGRQVMRQVMRYPAALTMSAAVLACFLLVPGFPRAQFLVLALAAGGLGYALRWARSRPGHDRVEMPAMAREGVADAPQLIDDGIGGLAVPLAVRLAPDLRERLDPIAFNRALEAERDALRRDLGVPFPGLRMRYDASLPAGCYEVDVQEVPTGRHAFGEGADAVAAANAFAARIGEVVRTEAEAFIGSQEVQAMLERASSEIPDLVAEVQRVVPVARIAEVMRRLVQEGVSIRHVREICESLVLWGAREKDIVMLTEYVRVDLGRVVTRRYLGEGRLLRAVMLDADAEAVLRDGVQQGAGGGFIALPQETLDQFNVAAGHALRGFRPGEQRVLLASMDVRRYLRKILDAQHRPIAVLSLQELPPQVNVESVGLLSLDAASLPRAA